MELKSYIGMEPVLKTLSTRKLIGKRIRMTLAENKTSLLWKSFMPRRREIKNASSTDLFSIEVYDESLNFNDFNLQVEFEKWAAIEVSDFDDIPEGMESFTLNGGLYAVFSYRGAASAYAKTFHYIFETWFPASAYEVDKRPHFEVMGAKYKGEDPESEEEVWIPVKMKCPSPK